ncbi:coenzyme Q-binding protein COQ10 homolog, mitochondrial-like [Festucalex cinctus]
MVTSRKSSQRLFGSLLDVLQIQWTKFIRGNSKRGNARHVYPGGFLTMRRATLPLCASFPINTPHRTFINLAAPITRRRTEYAESRTLGYTREQMFGVVSNVEQYQHFVPWCKSSRVIRSEGGDVRAELEIGFPPVVERYTSDVTFVPNHQVRALCTDGSLFSHLETIWRFEPGPKDTPDSVLTMCLLSSSRCFILGWPASSSTRWSSRWSAPLSYGRPRSSDTSKRRPRGGGRHDNNFPTPTPPTQTHAHKKLHFHIE